MNVTVAGIVAMGVGILYISKPTIFRRGVWLKTSVAIRTLSEEGYKRYMRRLGWLFILAGVLAVLYDQGKKLGVFH